MSSQQKPTVAGSPVQSGPPTPVTMRPLDAGPGMVSRAIVLAAFLFLVFLWVGGWIPDSSVPWVIVFGFVLLLIYWVTGFIEPRGDGPRTAAELALGALIAFCAAWGLSLLVPPPKPIPVPAATMVIAIDQSRVHLGAVSLQPPIEAVDGQALVVTTTSDASGVRSRTVVALDVNWKQEGTRYLLTINRGDDDVTAKAAVAALAGSEDVWLLPGR